MGDVTNLSGRMKPLLITVGKGRFGVSEEHARALTPEEWFLAAWAIETACIAFTGKHIPNFRVDTDAIQAYRDALIAEEVVTTPEVTPEGPGLRLVPNTPQETE